MIVVGAMTPVTPNDVNAEVSEEGVEVLPRAVVKADAVVVAVVVVIV